MLIWLASYPRSGNTLSRAILSRVFDVAVPSLYVEARDDSDEYDWGDIIPYFPHPVGLDALGFAEWARARPELYVVKTHEMPDTHDDPAIIIVRDGRAAMASFERYTETWWPIPRALEEIVVGDDQLPNWSQWLHAWGTRGVRSLTLMFEEMIADPSQAIEKMSAFLGQDPKREFDLSFHQMQSINPKFFRIGSNEPGIAAVERRCPKLFWTLHGDHMRHFGYGDPAKPQPADPIGAFRELAGTINAQRQASGRRAVPIKSEIARAHENNRR